MFKQEGIGIKKAAKPEDGARSWKDDLGKDKAWDQSWRRGQGKQKVDRWRRMSASEPAVMETVWEKSASIPGKILVVTAPQKWGFKYGCIPSKTKS